MSIMNLLNKDEVATNFGNLKMKVESIEYLIDAKAGK